mmetsp:Transcript_3524/g.11498  ORF Transcript_3524/g.11498 Transcript_3524/m.11498 type:complete len:260 (+) Transcript_3524:425-1204(+)
MSKEAAESKAVSSRVGERVSGGGEGHPRKCEMDSDCGRVDGVCDGDFDRGGSRGDDAADGAGAVAASKWAADKDGGSATLVDDDVPSWSSCTGMRWSVNIGRRGRLSRLRGEWVAQGGGRRRTSTSPTAAPSFCAATRLSSADAKGDRSPERKPAKVLLHLVQSRAKSPLAPDDMGRHRHRVTSSDDAARTRDRGTTVVATARVNDTASDVRIVASTECGRRSRVKASCRRDSRAARRSGRRPPSSPSRSASARRVTCG